MSAPVWRHLLSIVLLPLTATVIVPLWLRSTLGEVDTRWASPAAMLVGRIVAVGILAAALGLLSWCVVLFARIGRGTLAPWDPTQRLVAAGPYRHVRNPMISAVAAILLGEALFLGSSVLAAWCAVFVLVNHVYFLISEEPGLEKRFGSAYLEYKRDVPRWIPKRLPTGRGEASPGVNGTDG